MPEGGFVNLQPKIESSGDLTFFKAEWWDTLSRSRSSRGLAVVAAG